MRRFLVVGCGGSGGATLAYLMDQLRSDLAAHGVDRLPQGWQFVQIDVPNTSEAGPDGLGSVEAQGGTYFGCGPAAVGYSVLDSGVSDAFAEKGAFDAIGTWAPRRPDQVNFPIEQGAGQFRAVGRMISLSRVGPIRRVLQSSWDKLNTPDADAELRGLRVPGLGAYDPGTPLVLVVSSMAGGAGASMALDVCRLLTLITTLNPRLMGVFLVAPNIFDGTLSVASRTGVRPNALAMLGEIVASQTRAAYDHDVTTLQALGAPGGAGDPIPFARVFPVGRFSGVDRMLFGDGSPGAVYRGLGRGLAGLIMSEKATTQFISYDLTNNLSPEGDRSLLGWGSDWDDLPWGSYGFASLSMGRDRYAEYAAQRIARSCVERLLHGHEQRGSQASSTEQVKALLATQWDGVCRRAGLPPNAAEVEGWMRSYPYPTTTVEAEATKLVADHLQANLASPEGLQAAQWLPALRQELATRSGQLERAAAQAAQACAFAWHQRMLGEVEREVTAAVGTLGLAYAVAVVERLNEHLRTTVAPAADNLAALERPQAAAVPRELDGIFAKLTGKISNGGYYVDRLLHGCRQNVAAHIYGRAAELTAALLRQFTVSVLGPLASALAQAQQVLEGALRDEGHDLGKARLATDHCRAWPSDSDALVPDRFDEADNEVLLTSSRDFQEEYGRNVARAFGGENVMNVDDARIAVVKCVVSGEWETAGGRRPPGGLLQRRAEWRSPVFPMHPRTGEPIVQSHARFDVHVRPGELLARAREFVARPGESFDDFCRLSITDFVKGVGASGEAEAKARPRELAVRFTQALTLARPLISVNDTALRKVHGTGIVYRYKFSEVPLRGEPVVSDLVRVLTTNPMIDETSLTNLELAIGDTQGMQKIDIWGSYPNYSPLVFDAVVEPAAEQWAGTNDAGRESFWRWRRSRPLNAALPMGNDERRAMVAGFLVGQVVGAIRLPASAAKQPALIWDVEGHGWLPFPYPMLTPKFIADYDWLPAILESVLIAIARSHEAPVMASLRPYQVLRGLFDDSRWDPAGGLLRTVRARDVSGGRMLTAWLGGEAFGGGTSAIPKATAAGTIDERAQLATDWLTGIRDLAGVHYMAPGRDGAPGGGTFSTVRTRKQASVTPMFRDVAPDVFWATGQLVKLLEEARLDAHEPPPTTTPIVAQTEEEIVIPTGWDVQP